VTLSAVNGFTGDVSLSLAGIPDIGWTFDPPVVPGGSGTTQLRVTTSSSITSGPHALRITGTSSAARTTTVDLTIQSPPDFTLTASPSTQSIPNGGSAAYQVAVGASNGFTGSVGLSLSGLPSSVGSASFTPSVVTTAGSSQLTIVTQTAAPPGSYPLTITATSGGLTHTAAITLVVFTRDFALTATPSSVTLTRGQTATYTLSTSAIGGFTGAVSLSVTGAPAGSTSTLSINPVGVPGSSTLRLRTAGSGPRGTFTVRVTGTSGTFAHQATVTLVVRA
jgi:hypothetical protein